MPAAALTAVAQGRRSLAAAKRAYEEVLLTRGFAAVERSRHAPFRPPAAGSPPAARPSPWAEFVATRQVGDIVTATVTAPLPIGVLVEVTAGVPGILVGAHAAPGARVSGRIAEIDHSRRRIRLATV